MEPPPTALPPPALLLRGPNQARACACLRRGPRGSSLQRRTVSRRSRLITFVHDLGIDDVVTALGTGRLRTAAAGSSLLLVLGGLVNRRSDALHSLAERLRRVLHCGDVLSAERFLDRGDLLLQLLLVGLLDLVAVVADQLLGLVREVVGHVAGLGLFAALTVLVGELL